MNARVTASAAASLETSWFAANARDEAQVAGPQVRLSCASILAGAFLASGRAALGTRSGFGHPDRGTRRRVDAELLGRYLHGLDAVAGQGKAEESPFSSWRTRRVSQDRKGVRQPRALPDGKLRHRSDWTGTWK